MNGELILLYLRAIARHLHDVRLPPRLKGILSSSGLLRGIRWFSIDVWGVRIGPIFKGQTSWTA